MNRDAVLKKIKESFMLKRVRAEEECDNFIRSLRRDKDFDKLYSELTAKSIERFRLDSAELEKEVEELNNKIKSYLAIKNIDYNKLKPKYELGRLKSRSFLRLKAWLTSSESATLSLNGFRARAISRKRFFCCVRNEVTLLKSESALRKPWLRLQTAAGRNCNDVVSWLLKVLT